MHPDRVSTVLAAALHQDLLTDTQPLALFFDLDAYRERLKSLTAAFPAGTLHAVAVKANPLAATLREANARGLGAEVASLAELEHAIRLGFPPHRVVFDSPAKTAPEIARALQLGVHLNADNLHELARIAALVETGRFPAPSVGVRVNPQVGAGAIEATSTATATSKFGVALADEGDALLEALRRWPWVRGLHVHTGSQGGSLDLMVRGVQAAVAFADAVDALPGRPPLAVLDVGGGVSVDYAADAPDDAFATWAAALQAAVPGLGRFQLVTEVGRALSAKAGWVASRVEATKRAGGRPIAVIHAGADLFVRTAYQPDRWPHRVTVHHPDGRPKDLPKSLEPWDVAGPLCFSGDLVARARPLPPIAPGDLLVVHDAGAYTLAMWSRYNSRQAPAVWGHEDVAPDAPPRLTLLKPAETVEDVLRFWGS